MTRLVARLALSLLLLPFAAVTLVISSVVIESVSTGTHWPPHPTFGVLLVGGAYLLVTGGWLLIWWTAVRWTPARLVWSIGAWGACAVVGALCALALQMSGVIDDWYYAIELGGLIPPTAWPIATVLIWRESRRERIARVERLGPGGVVCPACSYNLTGLHSSDCPECGARFTIESLILAQRGDGALAEG